MTTRTEADVEVADIEWLATLGWWTEHCTGIPWVHWQGERFEDGHQGCFHQF